MIILLVTYPYFSTISATRMFTSFFRVLSDRLFVCSYSFNISEPPGFECSAAWTRCKKIKRLNANKPLFDILMLVRLLIQYQKWYHSRTKLKQERKNNWHLLTHCSQKVLLRIAFCVPLKIVEPLWNLNFLIPLMKMMTQGMRAQRNQSQLAEHYLRITYSTQDNMNIKKTDAIIMYCEERIQTRLYIFEHGSRSWVSYLIYHHPKFWRTPSMFSQAHQKYQHQHQLL